MGTGKKHQKETQMWSLCTLWKLCQLTKYIELAINNNILYATTGGANKIVKITLPVLGLNDNIYSKNQQLVVYPNPTSEFVYIDN